MKKMWRKIWIHLPESKKFSSPYMTDTSQLIYILLILKADRDGRGYADADVLNKTVFLFMKNITPKKIETALTILHKVKLIELYEVSGVMFFQIVKWHEHQSNRIGREGMSSIPDPSQAENEIVMKDDEPAKPIIEKISKNDIEKIIIEYKQFAPSRMQGVGKFREWLLQNIKPAQVDDFIKSIHNYHLDCKKRSIEPQYIKHIYNYRSVWQDWLEMPADIQKKPAGLTLQQQLFLLEQEIDETKRKVEKGMLYDMDALYRKREELMAKIKEEK